MPDGLSSEEQAEWLMDHARYARALPLLTELVEQRRESGGGELAGALMGLGMVQDALGDGEEGVESLAQAWEIFQEIGAPPAMLGACADALGLACQGLGKFGDAEAAFRMAIDLRQQASPGVDEPWVAASRVHLGRLLLNTARYEEAGELLEAALASASDPVSRATRLRHLGTYYHTIGGYVRAIGRFDEALEIARDEWGENSEQVAALLGDVGLSQLRAGEVGPAETNLLRSRDLIAALENPPLELVAASEANLATFYLFKGEIENAAQLLEGSDDAVALNNLGSAYHLAGNFDAAAGVFAGAKTAARSLGDHHPLRVQILQNEACLLADAGKMGAALVGAGAAGSAALAQLEHLLAFGSEGQKLDFRRTSDPLSLLCSFGAGADEIAEMVLRTKGVVLDSVLRGDGELGDVNRDEIPAGKTFIDYFVYQKYLGRGRWQQCYGAIVLRGDSTRWVTLGKSESLRILLKDLQAHMEAEAVGGNSDAVFSLKAVLEGLYDFCIAPLGADLGDSLVISPGGDLGVVPFAALRHGGRFFCEIVSDVKLVASGRRIALDAKSGDGDEAWAQCSVSGYSGAEVAWPGGDVRFGEELWEKLSDLGDLPGVARERAVLSGVADFSELPSGEFLLRRALKKPVRVLHFSCHGFFLGEGSRPMFRSGLVLDGARRSLVQMAIGETVDSGADNVLFAGEVAELDLSGTELVTLAACDTGLGVSVAGEGVLGLQRGFQLAGARNILMTLWAVGDQSLPEFLKEVYARIAAGEAASAAVWQVQARRLNDDALAKSVWTAGGFTVLARQAD